MLTQCCVMKQNKSKEEKQNTAWMNISAILPALTLKSTQLHKQYSNVFKRLILSVVLIVGNSPTSQQHH